MFFSKSDWLLGIIAPIAAISAAVTLAVVFGVPWVWGLLKSTLSCV